MSFSEWKEVKLKDICDYKTGKLNSNAAQENGVYPFFTCSPEAYRINSYSFDQDAILLAGNNANGKFHINYYKGKFDAYQRTYVMASNDDSIIDNTYLYYYLTLQLNNLKEISVGSATRFLTKGILDNISIKYPQYKQMKYIGKTLRSLDEKIELNNQMNKTLEEMAQALFKRWFVDFEFPNEDGESYKSSGGEMVDSELGMIPKGWQVGILGDISNIVMGQSPKGSTYNEEGVGEVFYQGRAEFGTRFPKRRLYTSEPKRMANKGDVLMSVRAPVGDLNVAHEKCCIGRGLAAIQSKYGYESFILYTMFNLEKQLNVFNGEGTVFGSINKDGLNNLKVIVPSPGVIKNFEEIVSKIDGTIQNNYDEVCSLQELRDILLPKLMLGEIRIK